jgi:alpha-mannosidase
VSELRLLHMIGNAHIDPVWLWRWQEGYQEVRSTFQSAIERMEEYPEFVFTCDSVCYLRWIEESDPELFEQVRARIADGRLQVTGGWWIEPDCNIPGGESFVRQALYGQRYLRDRFGITATTGSNVDPFGHNATIPQLLRKSGMDSYVFLRPGPHELELPGAYFWWESPDGSRVLAYRIPHEYCSPRGDIGYHVDKSLAQLPKDRPELMVFYGVGNHGGGPTRANIESIHRLDAMDGLPRLEFSSPRAFFDRVLSADGDIPTHAGELQHHCVGCYSAHSGVKRWNRRAENLLERAEKWSVVADVLADRAYPLADLTEAWKLTLFNQFHDILAGTSIKSAYDDARDGFGHACSLAEQAFNRAVQAIGRRIDIPAEPDMTPIVVFNPHPWPLRTDVEFEFAGFPSGEARMADDDGNEAPVQRIRSQATLAGSRGRLAFPADVPPLGYRLYRIYPAGGDSAGGVSATETTLENELLAVEVDPATGWVSRLEDKRTGVDLVSGRGSGHAVVIDDQSDTWGHRVKAYDEKIGEFECTSVRLVEHGPVRAVLRIESRYESSTLVEEVVLGARAPYVEVRVVLDWHERHRLLKLRVPTSLAVEHATFEVPYGHVERPAGGDEEPAQAWVDVSAEGAGLSVLNDCKYGHDVKGGDVGVTVARSPVYACHEPALLDPNGTYDYLDQRRQEFTYRLLPHGGDWREAGTVRLAAELNQPPFALLESYHRGDLPQRASYAAVDGVDVVVTVLKVAEDGDGTLIVRGYETAGRPARATIELPLVERTIEAEFGAHEIKTFKVPRDPEAAVAETSLLEW